MKINKIKLYIIILLLSVSFNSCGIYFGSKVKQCRCEIDGKPVFRTTVINHSTVVAIWVDDWDDVTYELIEYRALQADSVVTYFKLMK